MWFQKNAKKVGPLREIMLLTLSCIRMQTDAALFNIVIQYYLILRSWVTLGNPKILRVRVKAQTNGQKATHKRNTKQQQHCHS